MSNRRYFWLAALAALPIVAAGCGGGAKEETPAFEEKSATTASTTTAAPGAAAPATSAAAAPAGGATISGKVSLTGTAPAMEKLKMDADNYCKSTHASPSSRKTSSRTTALSSGSWSS